MSLLLTLGKAWKLVADSEYRFMIMANMGLKKSVSGEVFLRRLYRYKMGKELDLSNPTTYTEKLQWLKLYDHRPEYTQMVDKYEAKSFVAEKIGAEYVVPLLAVWDSVEDISFDALPDQFVLKTTHDSGGIIVCKNKADLSVSDAKKKLRYFFNRDYYARNREWPYKDVPHRVIAEAYMEDSLCGELRDYKFFTFGGVPKVLYVAQGRGRGGVVTADFFDMEFNHLPFTIDHEMASAPINKPCNFELMKELAAQLSQGTPQLRVDFYEVDGRVYFGEMTFFHCSGMHPFNPESWDKTFGDWVALPKKV